MQALLDESVRALEKAAKRFIAKPKGNVEDLGLLRRAFVETEHAYQRSWLLLGPLPYVAPGIGEHPLALRFVSNLTVPIEPCTTGPNSTPRRDTRRCRRCAW